MLKRAHRTRVAQTQTAQFPAPTSGWVQSGNITSAPPDQAEVLDNYIPTAQGARLRGGSIEYADLGASVKRIMVYKSNTEQMFASTETKLFDADRVSSGSNTFAELEGLGSGDWSDGQMSNTAGEFLLCVNGTDLGWFFDGTDINPLASTSVYNLGFDAETAAFAVGETVTGGTSGATAEIYAITKTAADEGVLKLGTITGTFQDNETITDGATGSATSNIPSGTSTATTVSITNVASSALSQVWNFKERFFFVEKGTQSAWYLPVKSIGGAATEIPLGAVFRRGGELLFGATWSLDSGSGMDDVCVFISSNGEIAVYAGTDPASASTWSLQGVYDIGRPLNKHAYFKAGGDLAILTEDGIVPVSEALRKDRGALQAQAITYPIEDAWKSAIADATVSYPITATLWQDQTTLIIGTPDEVGGKNVSFAANSRTGAWGRILGWDVRCGAVVSDRFYFGTDAGKVVRGDAGGDDDGVGYTAVYVPKFQTFGGGGYVTANFASLTYRAPARATIKVVAHKDYNVRDISAPNASIYQSGSAWGTGVWGTFIWGGISETETFSDWRGCAATGYSLAPGFYITSNQTEQFTFEILGARLRYEVGYPI